jgi:hypothetical protein
VNALPAASGSAIEHADALDWLAAQEPGTATAVIYDPPYAVGSPVRGREDGAAGSVSGPLSFMQRTMALCALALRPAGPGSRSVCQPERRLRGRRGASADVRKSARPLR